MLAKQQVKLAKEKLTDEGLPFGGYGVSQDLVLLLGSVRSRLLPLLQVLGDGGGELAFLCLYLWLLPKRRQVVLHQLVELGKERVHKNPATL